MKNLAIIPARSGSKGVKDKNIRLLNGTPLMAYSINAAYNSEVFDEVMVSTDSKEYADIALEIGASVPFLRSVETSTDNADSWDMVKEVIENYKGKNREFDTVCLLQPTSPLRNGNDIKEAYKIFETKASVAVISVCEMEHTPLWSNTLPENGSLNGFIKATVGKRRQDNNKYYRLNGAIYIVSVDELLNNINLYREGSFAYIMPQDRSVDIDSEFDFKYAEFLIRETLNE